VSGRSFTLIHLRRLDPAIIAYQRHAITASRFAECVNAVMADEGYDLGDAWSLPERIFYLLAFNRGTQMTAGEIGERLGVDRQRIRETIAGRARPGIVRMRLPAAQRGERWAYSVGLPS
jgi:hypothetical protein